MAGGSPPGETPCSLGIQDSTRYACLHRLAAVRAGVQAGRHPDLLAVFAIIGCWRTDLPTIGQNLFLWMWK